jgi:hypothetical protein
MMRWGCAGMRRPCALWLGVLVVKLTLCGGVHLDLARASALSGEYLAR